METLNTNTPSPSELITEVPGYEPAAPEIVDTQEVIDSVPEHLISDTARSMAAKAINVYQIPTEPQEVAVHTTEGRFNNGVVPNENGRFNNGVVVLENGRYNNGTEPVETPNE